MKSYVLEIKWGLIFTAVALLWIGFERLMGWHGEQIEVHATYTNFFAIFAIGVYALALIDKRRQLGGVMSWKQGVAAGVIITAVVAVLSPLSQWITHALITPGYFPTVIEYAVSNDMMTRPEAEAYFSLQTYMLQGTIGALIMGLVTSALVALVVRKAPADAE